MKILEKSRDFTKVEIYLLTQSPEIISMKDVEDGTVIDVLGYLTFEDINKDGEMQEITAIISENSVCYAFQSSTFRKSLNVIAEIMEGEAFAIRKISGKTKAGRDYINCVLEI